MASLEDIRAKLAQMENNNSSNTNRPQSDNAIYPFWNIDEGQSVTLRFLPDDDTSNTFFWAERQMIRLTFPGVKGGDEKKSVTVQVPCGEMYGDTCPVLTEVRPWFKDPSLEDMGRKYWKKRSYIFQGFVNDSPLQEEAPENPIRRFVIGPQIFNIIKAALMDPDMDNIPVDYVNGTDFRLNKTTKGNYSDYNTSNWARKERSLNEEELAAIDKHGLFTLGEFLPARPTEEHYAVISEMFAASIDGELYDPAQWGNFYKPYGVEVPASAPQPGIQATQPSVQQAESAPAPAPEPIQESAPAPAPEPVQESPQESASGDAGKKSTDDILAMIRNRAQS